MKFFSNCVLTLIVIILIPYSSNATCVKTSAGLSCTGGGQSSGGGGGGINERRFFGIFDATENQWDIYIVTADKIEQKVIDLADDTESDVSVFYQEIEKNRQNSAISSITTTPEEKAIVNIATLIQQNATNRVSSQQIFDLMKQDSTSVPQLAVDVETASGKNLGNGLQGVSTPAVGEVNVEDISLQNVQGANIRQQ